MLFVSPEFLFGFLPLTLAVYWALVTCCGERRGIAALVVASLVFYAWWKPGFLLLLLLSIGVNYRLGAWLVDGGDGRGGRRILWAGVAFNLTLLGYFKYVTFFVENLNAALGTGWHLESVILPIGISFYTFQQIAYLADCHADRQCERSLANYALFVSFFPQLIAGPIVHHKEMLPQFAAARQSRVAADHRIEAVTMFVIALFKKLVIADSLAVFATGVFSRADGGTELFFFEAWLGLLAFAFQIYFDFSAYSEMAIALGLFFGIRLPINFLAPYRALNISEFWQRWHITLSRFLRDYLYIPLGGNRRGRLVGFRNFFIVMVLGGLWHGASWNFVIWGALHGFFLAVRNAWTTAGVRLPGFIAWPLTFFPVVAAWSFFRAETPGGAVSLLASAAGLNGFTAGSSVTGESVFPNLIGEKVSFGAESLKRVFSELGEYDLQVFAMEAGSYPATGCLWLLFAAAAALLFATNLKFSAGKWAATPLNAVLLGLMVVVMILRSFSAPPGEFIYFQF